VLERVVEDDRIELPIRPGCVGERAGDGVDAGGAGMLGRLRRGLDAGSLPAVVGEDGGEIADAAADVEDPSRRPLPGPAVPNLTTARRWRSPSRSPGKRRAPVLGS
jgi:hypothetical protein